MTKLLSLILSAVMLFSGQASGVTGVVDAVSRTLTGLPFYYLHTSSEFLQTITDRRVVRFDDNTGYIDDLVLVFLKPNTSLLQRYRAFRSVGGYGIGFSEPVNLFVLNASFDGHDDLERLCAKLMENEQVVFACGSYALRRSEDFTPNDPFDGFSRWDESNPAGSNWWLEAVDARNAWGYRSFFNPINVGIIDSGFDALHPELEGKISFPNKLLEKQNIPGSHGTHVAGIIAAQADNAYGISGLCTDASLICVDWQAEEGQRWISDVRIVFGVGYAIKAGAKVVNLSLGSSGSIPDGKAAYPQLWMDAEAALMSVYTALLISLGYDFIAVQSAGNGDKDGNPVDAFNNGTFSCLNNRNTLEIVPGVTKQDVLDRVIIVGSVRNRGNGEFVQSSFSNVGPNVSICAPGSSVYSCDLEERGYFSYKSGTSMAAPVVTGITALVWSVNPALTGAQVKAIVCDPQNTKYEVPPIDDRHWADAGFRSYPMINAQLAVEAAVGALHASVRVTGRTVKASEPVACDITAISAWGDMSFHAGSDGHFQFLLPPGESTLRFFRTDGTYVEQIVNIPVNGQVDLGDIEL